MTQKEALFSYLLYLGDNGLVQGHRLSELCSRGPILEEDLAMTNFALDYIGRASAFLKYAGEVEGLGRTEDDLAYKRGERQFYNNLIAELPNGDFAYTMVKQLMIACYEFLLFTELSNSKDEIIAGISAKTLKEVRYHFAHSRDWCIRLGKGTAVSHAKLQNAFNDLWMYSGELFEMTQEMNLLTKEQIAFDLGLLKTVWQKMISTVLKDATIELPAVDYMQTGSRQGIHTEHLGHILSEMQYLQRAYPDAKW